MGDGVIEGVGPDWDFGWWDTGARVPNEAVVGQDLFRRRVEEQLIIGGVDCRFFFLLFIPRIVNCVLVLGGVPSCRGCLLWICLQSFSGFPACRFLR